MTTWSRRAVLVGAAGALAACSTDTTDHTSPPSRPGSTGPASTSSPPTTSGPGTPSGAPRWSQLRRHVDGTLVLPDDDGYDDVRLLQDPRFDDQRPLAVLTVAGADDVATAFAFAQDAGVPVALRSGGHCYAGWSAGGDPRALVLDCRGLDGVDLADDGTATIGPGALLLDVYEKVGGAGRALAAGSCPTVGFGGLTLGGGVGVLTRAMGLTCDAVTSMQVVTASGDVVTASADEEPDLFWALRGGGGGHVGVVTSFTTTTQPAPDLSTAYLQWPLDVAPDVLPAWQDWAPTADARLWSTMKGLGGASHTDGAILLVSATWTGPDAGFAEQLAELLDHVPAPDVDSRHRRSYVDAMRTFAGTPGRSAFGATSHVAYDPLDDAGVRDLVARVRRAQDSGLTEAGVSVDALGGTVGDLAPGDTAFVHRDALATVQYTATFDDGADAAAAAAADAYVHGFRDAMTPHWGDHAYVNYADPTLDDPSAAYFGDNAGRLASVRHQYDPDGFFTQPQDW